MTRQRILMVAAENDSLPNAKVGGVGDVLRDLPVAIETHGPLVDSIMPSYGFLARLPSLKKIADIPVSFSGGIHIVEIFEYKKSNTSSSIYVLHNALFSSEGETVYISDLDDRPFATDATKFAFFCAAVAQALLLEKIPRPDVLHCHDWHSAFLLMLITYSDEFLNLRSIRTVFTIHNLVFQGVRPFSGDSSSLRSWFLNFPVDESRVCDPKYNHCLNPMRAGIELADAVNTVSDSYAIEILQASDYSQEKVGGEGLEKSLIRRHYNGELFGVVNGCEYPSVAINKSSRKKLVATMTESIVSWAPRDEILHSVHWIAEQRIKEWAEKKNTGFTMTSIGRVTNQKLKLLVELLAYEKTALQCMLDDLGDNGVFIMLGCGDADLEHIFTEHSAKNKNFIFLNGYSKQLSHELYSFGDLFLMPSTYEPCGISQLLAMRTGQPCLVNRVGGLRDTVTPSVNGFAFEGNNAKDQANAMLSCFREALTMYLNDAGAWKTLTDNARHTRFSWQQSAKKYIKNLYRL